MAELTSEEVLDLVNKYERVYEGKRRWYTSRNNLLPIVRAQVRPPKSVICKDETLREGLESASAYATQDEKMKVVEALIDAGVTQMEVGNVYMVDEHYDFAKRIKKEKLPITLSSHASPRGYPLKDAAHKAALDRVIDSGTEIMNFVAGAYYSSIPQGGDPDAMLEEAINTTIASVEYSVDRGIYVSWGLSNIGAMRLDWAERMIRAAVDAGIKRCYLYDVYGSYTSELMKYLTLWMRGLVGPEVEIAIHCHNDLGMAVANSLAAVATGEANIVDTVVNGLGDRAGNCSFEEFVCGVESMYGVNTGIDLSKLYSLSQFVEKTYGIAVQYNKPIVGRNAYEQASHAASILRARMGLVLLEYPIAPEAVGRGHTILYGTSNISSQRDGAFDLHARMLGYKPSDEQLEEITEGIRQIIHRKRVATEEAAAAVIRGVMETGSKTRR